MDLHCLPAIFSESKWNVVLTRMFVASSAQPLQTPNNSMGSDILMFPKKHILPSLNIKSERNIISPVAEGQRIPKILHQTFHGKILPQAIQENIKKIRATNPEWEYRF